MNRLIGAAVTVSAYICLWLLIDPHTYVIPWTLAFTTISALAGCAAAIYLRTRSEEG